MEDPSNYRKAEGVMKESRQDRADRDARNAPKIAAAEQAAEAEMARLAVFSAPGFSLTRRPCRERLAAIVAELARARGATVKVESGEWREWVDVEIEFPRGLNVLIPIHSPRQLKSEAICLHWYVRGSDVRLSDAVAWDVNNFHRQKATDVVYGAVALCNLLADHRFDQIYSGVAFMEES